MKYSLLLAVILYIGIFESLGKLILSDVSVEKYGEEITFNFYSFLEMKGNEQFMEQQNYSCDFSLNTEDLVNDRIVSLEIYQGIQRIGYLERDGDLSSIIQFRFILNSSQYENLLISKLKIINTDQNVSVFNQTVDKIKSSFRRILSSLQMNKCFLAKPAQHFNRFLLSCSNPTQFYNEIKDKCEVCQDCSVCDTLSSKRQNQIICSICLYKKSGDVKRLDGSCQKLPDGQNMNVWGKIEGCDSVTCNCVDKKCVSCKVKGHYIYPELNQCYQCIQGRYVDGIYCQLCKPKEELTINDVSCDSCGVKFQNCKECNNQQCTLCQTNYGLDLNSQCISCQDTAAMIQVGIYCIPKPKDCKKLTESSINIIDKTIICDECNDANAIKDDTNGSCKSSCPNGQYNNKGACTPCTQGNCVNCPNNKCIQCKGDQVFNLSGDCITPKLCVQQDRSYVKNGQCIKCDPAYYYDKSGKGSCEPCDTSFQYFIDTSGECQKCHSECMTCKGEQVTDCLTCFYQGYTLEPISKSQSRCKCKNIQDCLFCSENDQNQLDCYKCKPGFTSSTPSKNDCDKQEKILNLDCPLNYKEDGARGMVLRNSKELSAQKRCYCNTPNCTYCDLNDGMKCVICYENFELTQDLQCKECPSTYRYDRKNQKCVCQDYNCKQCDPNNGNLCQQCDNGYFVNKKKQCEKCEVGYVYDSLQNKCVCGIQNCKTCNSTNPQICSECKQGFVQNGNNCEECQNGFKYDSLTKKCICAVDNCSKCISTSGISCEKCNSGFELNIFQQCIQCSPNYTYNDTTQKCQCSISQCLQCEPLDGSICSKCEDGMQFNTLKKICERCNISNCSNCVQNKIDQCQICEPGYSLNSSKICEISIPKCIQLNPSDPTQCLKCDLHFQLESNKCICSINNCKTCGDDGSTCITCKEQYVLNTDKRECKLCDIQDCQECQFKVSLTCKICKPGYKLDGTSIRCQIAIDNCIELESTNPQQCKQCDTNYKLSNGICICKISDCKNCQVTFDGKCAACENGFTFDNFKNQCACSIPNCFECDKTIYGNCKKCISNYDQTSSSECKCQVNSCLTCDPLDGSKCTQCQNGFSWNSSTKQCECSLENCKECSLISYGQCKTCFTNYQLNGNICKCQVSNCKACEKDDGQICNTCLDNYVLENQRKTCRLCIIQGCRQCQDGDSSKCQQCKDGYKSNSLGTCDPKIDNCIKLNDTDISICDQCKDGFSFDTISRSCKCIYQNCINCSLENGKCKNCQDGFEWDDQIKSCKCSLKNCQECDTINYGNCKICNNGFVKDTNQQCQCSVTNCIQCNLTNGSLCDKCDSSYVYENQNCVQCAINKCNQCVDGNSQKCASCKDGYKIKDNGITCEISIQHCKQLDLTDSLKCLMCEDNYVKNINGNCECKFSNCKDCNISNTNGQCSTCQQGFSWSSINNQCECSIQNCFECDSQSNYGKCKTCINGYVKDLSSICQCTSNNCKTCNKTEGFKCDDCLNGYVLDKQTQQCLRCQIDNCKSCNDNDPLSCKDCNEGYITDNSNKQCKINIQNCTELSLSDKSKCNKCDIGYKLNSQFKCDCLQNNCENCSLDVNGKCQKCNLGFEWNQITNQCQCSIKNCQECDTLNYGNCKICTNGYQMNGSNKKCNCPINNCKECNPIDGSKCDVCDDSHVLNSSTFQCVKCEVFNCEKCQNHDQEKCQICSKGFTLDQSNSKCKISIPYCQQLNNINPDKCDTCQNNYSVDQFGKCQCSLANCINCIIDIHGACSNCQNGFEWDNFSKQCKCKISNCHECDNVNYGKCKQCVNGYQMNSSNDQCSCTSSNCKSCNDINGQLCDVCQKGYTLDRIQQKCTTCQLSNCNECKKNDNSECQVCEKGYLLTSSNTCEKIVAKCQIQNCLTCDPSNNLICQVCQNQYSLNQINKSCELCSVENCQKCESQNYLSCQQCNNSYSIILNYDQTNKCKRTIQKFTLNPKITKQGYEVKVQFEYDILNSANQFNLSDIMTFSITNKQKYTYTYEQSSPQTISIIITMNENCKQEDIKVEFISYEFIKLNNLSHNKVQSLLPTFIKDPAPQQSQIEGAKVVTETTTKVAFISAVGLAILGSFFSVFSIVDVTAFIYFLFYVNVYHPQNVEEFSLLFGNFQFAFIPDFLTGNLGKEYEIESPHKFKSKGIDSFFLKNISHSLTFALIILGIYLFLKVLSQLPYRKMQRLLVRGLKKGWENDAIIYVIWIVFTYVCVACMLQLTHISNQGAVSYFSYILFLFCFPSLLLTPLIFTLLINRNSLILLKPYGIKFSSLIQGLKVDTHAQLIENESQPNNKIGIIEYSTKPETDVAIKKSNQKLTATSLDDYSSIVSYTPGNKKEIAKYHYICKYTNVILFIRKIFFSMFIVFMHDTSYAQLTMISLMNVAMIIYYIIYQPHLRRIANIKNIITEVLFIIIQIIATQFNDPPSLDEEEKRIEIGWAYISFCLIILFIHTVDLVYELCQSILRFLRPLLQSKQNKTFPVNAQPYSNQEKSLFMQNISGINNLNNPSSHITLQSNQMLDVEQALNQNHDKVNENSPDNLKKSVRRKRTKITDFIAQIKSQISNENKANINNNENKIGSLAEMSFQANSKIQSSNVSFNQDASPIKLMK